MKYLITLFILLFSVQIQASNYQGETPEYDENKVYLSQEQLEIVDGAILVTINGHVSITRQINCDEKGIYSFIHHFDKITDSCFNGHKIWCWKCVGCNVRFCKGRCKCVEWE